MVLWGNNSVTRARKDGKEHSEMPGGHCMNLFHLVGATRKTLFRIEVSRPEQIARGFFAATLVERWLHCISQPDLVVDLVALLHK